MYLAAEFGDYDDQKHTDEFLSDYIFLPPVSHVTIIFTKLMCLNVYFPMQHIGPPSLLQSLIERVSLYHWFKWLSVNCNHTLFPYSIVI